MAVRTTAAFGRLPQRSETADLQPEGRKKIAASSA